MERIDGGVLLSFLEQVERQLDRKISLIAVGGTAMTILGLKPSTMDVDFNVASKEEMEALRHALRATPHGFKVDLFVGGLIFSQQLPDDYIGQCIHVATLGRISLSALHPLDIVATKIGRLAARDEEDIADCIRKYRLKRSDVESRAQSVQYIGNEGNYEANLRAVLKRFFKPR